MAASNTLFESKQSDEEAVPSGLDQKMTDKNVLAIIYNYVCEGDYKKNLTFFKNLLEPLKILGSNSIWGYPERVLPIIRANPHLLLQPITITDGPNGICPEAPVTLYQLLLWTKDRYVKDFFAKTFLQKVRDLLIEHYGVETANAQHDSWLKNWNEKAHVDALKAEFNKVARAFDKSSAMTALELAQDVVLQAAIKNFEIYIDFVCAHAKTNNIPQLWDFAAQFYTREKYIAYNDDQKLSSGSAKNHLFCAKILHCIDKHLPAWAMQAVSQVSEQFASRVYRYDMSTHYKQLLDSGAFVSATTGQITNTVNELTVLRKTFGVLTYTDEESNDKAKKSSCSLM